MARDPKWLEDVTRVVTLEATVEELERRLILAETTVRSLQDRVTVLEGAVPAGDVRPPFNPNLLRRVDDLDFSVRVMNCLRNNNIVYIGDLVQKSEQEMLRTPNFGHRSRNEILEVLGSMGLGFGMTVAGWPPPGLEREVKVDGNWWRNRDMLPEELEAAIEAELGGRWRLAPDA